MKVYVGANYSERHIAKRLMNILIAQGHKITVDWTRHDSFDINDQKQYAIEDVKGVKKANAVIFILERPHKYKGCWVEMGIALAENKKVIIIGNVGNSCLFTNHPKVKVVPDMGTFWTKTLKEWLSGASR